MTTFQHKLTRMKQLEQECYSLCFYLLENERDAVDAAARVMTDLFCDNLFFEQGTEEQLNKLKRISVFTCMGLGYTS